ncbi:MAG: AMP-binding protein [Acidimicrobiales bacterium]
MVIERGGERAPGTLSPEVDRRVALAPPPGQAPLPAANARELLERNAKDPAIAGRPLLKFGDLVITHAQFYEECVRFATMLRSRLRTDRPPHVGVLLDNTPDYVVAIGGAGLIGACIVGLNHTRRGENLARDITYTDVQLLITEPRHLGLISPIEASLDLPGGLLVSTRYADSDDPAFGSVELLEDALGAPADLGPEPDVESLWNLLFTSGTSSAPKAVRCTQRRLLTTGNRLSMVLDVAPHDVGYIAMPLFHSNSLMVGLAPALVAGASVGLARRFSASRFLDDVRRYGATWFNYTGKPLAYLLATPEKPDDADNTLRLAYGNEGSPQVVESVSRRFGVEVVDVFGSTEGAIALDRSGNPPRGSIGALRDDVAIVDPEGNPVPVAEFDSDGRLANADACVGEIVNTAGVGPFEGYYKNEEAMAATTRGGWYWSGDLGYIDADGWVYFAGRTADWLRVDGENFPAGPIDAVIARHPDVMLGAVYGVPDVFAGDQVMVALVGREGAEFDVDGFSRWLEQQPDLSPKWYPRYVRISRSLPQTPSNKVLTRVLQHEKFRSDRTGGDAVYTRGRGESGYHLMTADEESELRAAFDSEGRLRAWDL